MSTVAHGVEEIQKNQMELLTSLKRSLSSSVTQAASNKLMATRLTGADQMDKATMFKMLKKTKVFIVSFRPCPLANHMFVAGTSQKQERRFREALSTAEGQYPSQTTGRIPDVEVGTWKPLERASWIPSPTL